MFDSLLSLDRSLLISARSLLDERYAPLLRILGESVVIWWAVMLLSLWFIGRSRADNRYKIWALQIFFTIILTFVVYTVVNFGVPQWRVNPQEVAWGVGALIPHPLDNSFPSGHALFTASLIVGLIRFAPKSALLLWSIMFGLATASARVLAGIHYPGDILGGWILGGAGALVISLFLDRAFFRERVYAPLIRLAGFFRL